jgi:hypothetical protein
MTTFCSTLYIEVNETGQSDTKFLFVISTHADRCRLQRLRRLRHELSSPAQTLGIVGSKPTPGMDVSMCLYCVCVVLCVGVL